GEEGCIEQETSGSRKATIEVVSEGAKAGPMPLYWLVYRHNNKISVVISLNEGTSCATTPKWQPQRARATPEWVRRGRSAPPWEIVGSRRKREGQCRQQTVRCQAPTR